MVSWEVEGTDEFAGWFEDLSDEEQVSSVALWSYSWSTGHRCRFHTPRALRRPATAICASCESSTAADPTGYCMRCDPRRAAILLLGGDKTGNDRWYDEHVPIADTLYDEYLRELEREGLT